MIFGRPARAAPPRARTRAALAAAGLAVCAALIAPAPAEAAGRPATTASGCPTGLGRIACVDLTHQRMWVQVGRKVVFGPVPVRTGRRGYVTRTGLWHVFRRVRNDYSTLYHTPMPYSQYFSGGEAFHALVGLSLSAPPGSHGCVNMRYGDAQRLWSVLRLHDPVKVFGRKPGT